MDSSLHTPVHTVMCVFNQIPKWLSMTNFKHDSISTRRTFAMTIFDGSLHDQCQIATKSCLRKLRISKTPYPLFQRPLSGLLGYRRSPILLFMNYVCICLHIYIYIYILMSVCAYSYFSAPIYHVISHFCEVRSSSFFLILSLH